MKPYYRQPVSIKTNKCLDCNQIFETEEAYMQHTATYPQHRITQLEPTFY